MVIVSTREISAVLFIWNCAFRLSKELIENKLLRKIFDIVERIKPITIGITVFMTDLKKLLFFTFSIILTRSKMIINYYG